MTTQFLEADTRWYEAPEGKPVLKSYPDPLTKGPPWTIGFGSTGADISPDTVWTSAQCYTRMRADIAKLEEQCSHFPWWEDANAARQDVFIQMGYQMGFASLLKFTATLAAAARGAWETVAADMKNSLWATQTPGRAKRLAEQARTGVRIAQPYDGEATAQPVSQPKGISVMSLISSAFHFVFDHAFAGAARMAATANPNTVQAGIDAVKANPMPMDGSANSPAGVASGPIADLENALNELVSNFVKTTVDQLPAVGGVAEMTGLDQKAADAAKALLVLGEQHALTYLSALFSGHHAAVDAVTVKDSANA